jgi:putative ABC transport system permease protein
MEAIRSEIPEVEVLAPRLQGWSLRSGQNVVRGERYAAFNVMGDYPDYRKIDPCTMLHGRYINHKDIELKRKVCLLGEKVYEVMFDEGEDPVGEYLRVNGVYFMVIGVFQSNNPNINIGSNKKETIYLPFTTMQQTFNYGDQVHYFGFTVDQGEDVARVQDRIKPLLKKRHNIAPEDDEAIGGFNVQNEARMMEYTFLGINILIWVVGIGTLVAGAVGVSNIMLVIVKERTKEIGVQRAIGARPSTVISQILSESVFLTTIAGFIGLALGTFVLHVTNIILESIRAQAPPEEQSFFINPEIGLPMALSALVILIFVGLFAGFIPAMKAVRIKPIEALHHE